VSYSECAAEVKIGNGWSINSNEEKAVEESVTMMKKDVKNPNIIFLFSEASYEDDQLIAKRLRELTGAKIVGLEGTYAVFTEDGIHVGEKGSLAILGIEASSWKIGIGVVDMSEKETPVQIKAAASQAIEQAVRDAKKTLEDKPSWIFVAPTKLKEEPILEAIENVFGKNVKISGGTPGSPNVTANTEVVANGFALAIVYADTKIGTGFHAGIAIDNSKFGVVTAMKDNRRTIKEIDGKPAFEVYRKWAKGKLDDLNPAETPAIWSRSFALVRTYNLAGGKIGKKVVVPIKVNPDLSIITGADVKEGEKLYFATATKKAYIKRAGTIIHQSLVDGRIKYSELAGGLHVYCRGAAFSQFGKNKENLQQIIDESNRKINRKPYIGTFTAGEQGNIRGHGFFMGNLTSSMVLFSK
jgi:hypothetical protein